MHHVVEVFGLGVAYPLCLLVMVYIASDAGLVLSDVEIIGRADAGFARAIHVATNGDPDLGIVIFDVVFRIDGGTNVYMGVGSQYSKLYFGRSISLGRRIAMEVRECVENYCLGKIVT